MRDHKVINIMKILNLCEYDISRNDVCWNKVKMTSSKWITCCHHRVIYDHHQPSSIECSSNHSSYQNDSHRIALDTSKIGSSIIMPSSNNSTMTSSSPTSISSVYDSGIKSPSLSSSSSSTCSPFGYAEQTTLTKYQRNAFQNFENLRNHTQNYHCHPSVDDSMYLPTNQSSSISVQRVITLINPYESILINCETNSDTVSAQICPEQDIIAVANDYWLAFYSIKDNECLATLQFPDKCLFWIWLDSRSLALITENDVFHWNMSTDHHRNGNHNNHPKHVFALSEDIKQDCQIVNYCVDPLHGMWNAVTTLFIDDDGEIGGRIQIFSHSYMHSECIEAHSCTFSTYQFKDNSISSTNSVLLLAVKRESKHIWKLYIIELTSIPNSHTIRTNRPLKSQQLMLHMLRTTKENFSENNLSFDDIPSNIICDDEVGLIFIVSKYGSFYICDLETGTPIHYEYISKCSSSAIFSMSYNKEQRSLLLVCRDGQICLIQIFLEKLLQIMANKNANSKLQAKIFERIKRKNQTDVSHRSNDVANHDPQNLTHHNCSPCDIDHRKDSQNSQNKLRNHLMINEQEDSIIEHHTTDTLLDGDAMAAATTEEEITRL